MQTVLQKTVFILFAIQITIQGHPIKGSFRSKGHRTSHETHSSFQKSNHGIQHSRPRKQSTKNDLGKAKSSFEYDLDNENGFRDQHDSHDFLNFYNPETGLDKMHLTPVDDNHSMQIREPHLRFDYTYDNSESEHVRHSPHRRVDSYAGEMIDDENTLSQFIAPPVFENNRNKAHEMQNEKVLYGTPEAKSAENANTKSLLESLNSLMSPLPSSGGEKNLANEFESEKDPESDSSRNGIDYGGKYHVISNLPDDNKENYHDKGNEDEREFRNDEGKFHDGGNYDQERSHDGGNFDEDGSHERGGERGNYNENRFREGARFNDERNSEEPHHIEKYRDDRDRSDENNFRDRHSGTENFERPRAEDHERSDHYENNGDRERHFEDDHHFDESADTYNDNHDRNADTRSSENHAEPSYNRFNYPDSNSDSPQTGGDGGEENSSFRHEEPDNSEKSESSERNENNGNAIEMVQDNSGKLHPMSNNDSKEDITKEVQKYIGNTAPNV
eukprot:Seg1194.6 transcript_id=Seg1194.6/GoldUCD/mRNA.D3Y31 product="hypothetical protein" protein_id=Seg1194.6/GoldUCD/D3Y31